MKHTISHYKQEAVKAFDNLQVLEDTFGEVGVTRLLAWYCNSYLTFEEYDTSSEIEQLMSLGSSFGGIPKTKTGSRWTDALHR
jgi:hypothetical protein